MVKKKVLQREIAPSWTEADLTLQTIADDISFHDAGKVKTQYSNAAMWCFSNDEKARDFTARIEGTYNNGRFTKDMNVEYKVDQGTMKYFVRFECCFKYDYLEALNHLPTDYVRPSEIAQATFVGKTKNDCCDGTYQRSKDKHNDRFMWDKVSTTSDMADRRFIYWDSMKNKWCVAEDSKG
jgi:hypothetical protein